MVVAEPCARDADCVHDLRKRCSGCNERQEQTGLTRTLDSATAVRGGRTPVNLETVSKTGIRRCVPWDNSSHEGSRFECSIGSA